MREEAADGGFTPLLLRRIGDPACDSHFAGRLSQPSFLNRLDMEVKDMMKPRIILMNVNPAIIHAMLGLEKQVSKGGLDNKLLNLVRMRASQINGCAFCLDMHSKDARAAGETEQRLYGLNAWRETPYYSARERAALEWTEALTLVTEGHVPDEVYERVRQEFSEDELAHLSLAIVAINGWNRLNVAARTVPGDYVPGSLATHATS
jgi:AhpD family alkylhydroperoxidase